MSKPLQDNLNKDLNLYRKEHDKAFRKGDLVGQKYWAQSIKLTIQSKWVNRL